MDNYMKLRAYKLRAGTCGFSVKMLYIESESAPS